MKKPCEVGLCNVRQPFSPMGTEVTTAQGDRNIFIFHGEVCALMA